MIKSNRKSQQSILRSGYRNRLRQYGENESMRESDRSNVEESRVVTEIDKIQRDSVRSRNSSVQRAFNSKITKEFGKKSVEKRHYQVESQVQPFRFIENGIHRRISVQRRQSEPVNKYRLGESGIESEVNTQIETLNRLREEHEILRQVVSEEDFNGKREEKDKDNGREVGEKEDQKLESKVDVGLRDIKMKGKARGKAVKDSSFRVISKQDVDNEGEQDIQAQNVGRQEFQANDQQIAPRKQTPQQQKKNKITHDKIEQLTSQVSYLQSALTQSSLKIQELLTEGVRNKQYLRQHHLEVERSQRLGNQLKLMRENQIYLNREVQMCREELRRGERRCKLIRETVEMLQRENKQKDQQIVVLESAIQEYKRRVYQVKNSENLIQSNIGYKQSLGKQSMDERQTIMKYRLQVQRLEGQVVEERNRSWRLMEEIKSSNSAQLENTKSYYSQLNSQLQEQLNQLMEENFKLRGENSQLKAMAQHSKRVDIADINRSSVTELNSSETHVTPLSKYLLQIRNQLRLLASSQTKQTPYLYGFQQKVRQLQEVIEQQALHKTNFIQELSSLKKEGLEVKKENWQFKRELIDAKGRNVQLEGESKLLQQENAQLGQRLQVVKKQLIQLKETTVSLSEYSHLQSENARLKRQLQTLQRENLKQLSIQDQQLYHSLTQIKEEYIKLEEAYLQKISECQALRREVQRQKREMQDMERQMEEIQRQMEEERRYSAELVGRVEEKEMRMLGMIGSVDNVNMYKERINQLQAQVLQLQLLVKHKESLISQLQHSHRQSITDEQLVANDLKLQLSSHTISKQSVVADYKQRLKQHQLEIDNLKKQLQLKNDQLKQIELHYEQLRKISQEMHVKQVKLLEGQLYQFVQEKERLLQQNSKIPQLEYQLSNMIIKERAQKKHSQTIDHLWMVKEAQYNNISQVISLVKNPSN